MNGIVQCLRPVRNDHGFVALLYGSGHQSCLLLTEAWKDDSYEICEKPVQEIIKRFYEHEAGNLINVIFVKEKEQSVLMGLISVMTDCFFYSIINS